MFAKTVQMLKRAIVRQGKISNIMYDLTLSLSNMPKLKVEQNAKFAFTKTQRKQDKVKVISIAHS